MPSQHEPPFDDKESLSAAMDGVCHELELHRLLMECSGDSRLRQRWVRYHLVSAVIQKQHTVLSDSLSFADAVHRAIDNGEKDPGSSTDKRSLFHHGGKMVSRVAVAASVALLVVVGTQWQQHVSREATRQVAGVLPVVQHTDFNAAIPTQKTLVDVSNPLGVENIFTQSGDAMGTRFGRQSGFENASLKTGNTKVPLINAAEQGFPGK
jgi:negative regulator of sigma E activity